MGEEALAPKCCCWVIAVVISVALYVSISNGKHEHESCCLADQCLVCLENSNQPEYCDWPCDFPDNDNFVGPNPVLRDLQSLYFDDAEGTCTFSYEYKANDDEYDNTFVTSAFNMS